MGNPGYVKIWTVGALIGILRWLELLALGIYGLEVTGSPTLVALLVVLRFLPLAVLGVIMGALSDLVSPRRLLLAGLAGIGLFSAGLAVLFATAAPGYPAAAVAAVVAGVFWAAEMPIRRKMIGTVVEPRLLAGAMAFDGAASNAMRLFGPLIGGVLYALSGIAGVFVLSAVLYAIGAAITLTLPADPRPDRRPGGQGGALAVILRPLRGAAEAFAHVRRDGDAMRILLVTVLFNIWGFPYLSMVPVIGRDELGLSPVGVGFISAVEGLFAMLAALTVVRLRPATGLRRIYFGATAGMLVVLLVMGLFPGFWVAVIGLAAAGACTALFSAMQSTLVYMVAPPGMGGRYLGLMTISIGTGVLGFTNIGITAELFGASNALWIVALQGLPVAIAIAWRWTALHRGG